MGFNLSAFAWAGFAASSRFRNGLFYPRNQTLSLRSKEDPVWPHCRGAATYVGTGSSCELKFIGKFKETESPSNDAMVSGASKFPGLKQPVSTDFPKE